MVVVVVVVVAASAAAGGFSLRPYCLGQGSLGPWD